MTVKKPKPKQLQGQSEAQAITIFSQTWRDRSHIVIHMFNKPMRSKSNLITSVTLYLQANHLHYSFLTSIE